MYHPIYKELVLREYRTKRDKKVLYEGLMHPSPARLKDACKRACAERYERRDERTLNDFLGKGNDQASFLKAIAGVEIDKFRPLGNFIKQETGEPAPNVIELLAWLIDFQDRPFDYGKKYFLEEPVGTVETGVSGGLPEVEVIVRRPFRRWYGWVGLMLVICLGVGGYLIFGKRPIVLGPQRCMYWAEDHFEQVDCGKKMEGVQVIALDSERLVRFRKITRQDTITYQSIGHVWYVRVNGGYEFYTSDGVYPTDPRVRLRPLTAYIIKNHLPGDLSERAGH
jgi:hypothetical protein